MCSSDLGWIDRYGDHDGDGMVEYQQATPTGLANQGWKDSHDAVSHHDGRLAEGAIALCEVQGYVYAAKQAAAGLARALDRVDLSDALKEQAERLYQQFDAAFWSDRLGFYALALDGNKRRCEVASSNAGQGLFTGIVPPERVPALTGRLMDRD